jgi:hypothetical protein
MQSFLSTHTLEDDAYLSTCLQSVFLSILWVQSHPSP